MKKIILLLFLTISVTSANAVTECYYVQGKQPERVERYIVTFEIRQSTFTLDVFEHMKNKINAVEFTIATDKETYNSISVGQEVSRSFKLGSLVFNGDFSNLKIIVKRKTIQNY